MAQQMITLEEAAEKLGISPEEMKKRLKTDPEFKRLSQIRDGATVRFKLTAIEELARQLGMASDQDLPLADIHGEIPGSDDFKIKGPGKPKPKQEDELPLEFSSTEQDLFSLADDSSHSAPKSSGKLTPSNPKGMSDSSTGSDSDVRLDGDKPRKPKSEQSSIPTEEISLDIGGGVGSAVIKGGSSAKLSPPKAPGSSGKITAANGGKAKPAPDSSEFELSLDADSDDFELQMNQDAGDEVDLGTMPKDKAGGSGKASKSGINLREPADSGISLEKGKAKQGSGKQPDSDSDVDFELSLDSSASSSVTKLGTAEGSKVVLDPDSDSEFELTLNDSSGSSLEQAALASEELAESSDKGDIFETDFEIPPMPDESASEAVALESDTDLEAVSVEEEEIVEVDETSDSEVVLLGDDDEAVPAGRSSPKLKGRGRSADDDDDESAAKALKGVKGKRRIADEEEEEEEAMVPAGAVVERPTKPWGVLPTLFLAPTFILVVLGAIMGFEMLNTMWGYQQPRKPASPVLRGIASTLEMELRDQ